MFWCFLPAVGIMSLGHLSVLLLFIPIVFSEPLVYKDCGEYVGTGGAHAEMIMVLPGVFSSLQAVSVES